METPEDLIDELYDNPLWGKLSMASRLLFTDFDLNSFFGRWLSIDILGEVA